MKFLIPSAVLCMALLSVGLCSYAQTPEGSLRSEEIDIIKPYQPILADAVKISFTPQPPKNDINIEPLSYDVNPKLPTIQYLAPNIKPIAIGKETTAETLPILFAKIGFGNYTQPYINLAYSHTNNKQLQYGINVLHHSARSKKIIDQKFADNSAKLFINQYGKKWVQLGQLNINYNNRTPYAAAINSNRMDDKVTNTMTFVDLMPSYTIHNYQEKNKGLWISSTLTPWYYKCNFGYAAKSVTEMGIDLNNRLVYPVKKDKIITQLNLFYNNTQFNENFGATSLTPATTPAAQAALQYGEDFTLKQQNVLANINPFYQLNKTNLQVEVGVNTGLNGKVPFLYPQFNWQYQLIKNTLTLYNGYSGGVVKNTFKKMMAYNPFTNYYTIRNTISQEGFVGLKGNVNNKLAYNTRFALQNYKHMPFLINDYSSGIPLFKVAYNMANAQIFNSHADVEYHILSQLTLQAAVDHYIFIKPATYYQWHQPSLTGSVNLKYQVTKKININSNCMAYNESKTLVNNVATKVPGYIDWSAAVNYQFHKNLHAFATVNNILNNKNARFYGYPNFGTNGLIGIVLNY